MVFSISAAECVQFPHPSPQGSSTMIKWVFARIFTTRGSYITPRKQPILGLRLLLTYLPGSNIINLRVQSSSHKNKMFIISHLQEPNVLRYNRQICLPEKSGQSTTPSQTRPGLPLSLSSMTQPDNRRKRWIECGSWNF